MKTRIAMMTALVLIAMQFSFTQETEKKFDTEDKKIAFAKKNLLASIQSSNTGVIEASLRVTAQLKMLYPAQDVSDIVEVMDDLWMSHPEGRVRYKAYIAKSICESPEWYAHNGSLSDLFDDNFFYVASDRMKEQLLSSK